MESDKSSIREFESSLLEAQETIKRLETEALLGASEQEKEKYLQIQRLRDDLDAATKARRDVDSLNKKQEAELEEKQREHQGLQMRHLELEDQIRVLRTRPIHNPKSNPNLESVRKALGKRITEQQQEIKTLEADNKTLHNSVTDGQERERQLEVKTASLETMANDLKADLETQKEDKATLESRQIELTADLERRKGQYESLAVHAQELNTNLKASKQSEDTLRERLAALLTAYEATRSALRDEHDTRVEVAP